MNKSTKIIILLLGLSLLIPFTQSAGSSGKPLSLAYTEYRPFCYKDTNGEVRGILVDFWKLWSRKTGKKIEFKLMPWAETISAVRTGEADINPGIFYTPERDKIIDFSVPYYQQPAKIFYNKNSEAPKTLADLKGRRIGVVKADYNLSFLRKHQPKAILVEYPGYEELVIGAVKDEVPYFVMEKIVALNYLAKHEGLKKILPGPEITRNKFRAAVKQGNKALLNEINKGLAKISPKELTTILHAWTGRSTSSDKHMLIACASDDEPFQFIDKNGKLRGFLIDLWKLWAIKSGVAIDFHSAPQNELITLLENGQVDIISGLALQNGKAPAIKLSDILWESESNYFFQKNFSSLNQLSDLNGLKVGAISNSKEEKFLKRELNNAILKSYPDAESMYQDVKDGKLKVFADKTATALFHLREIGLSNEYSFHARRPFFNTPYKAAVKDNAKSLLTEINQGMRSITPREIAEIRRVYLKKQIDKSDKKDLIIACSKGYPPLSMAKPMRPPTGLLVDMWKLWAKKADRSVKFRTSDWEGTLEALENGEADIHIGLFKTTEREKWMDFSQTFFELESGIFYPVKQDEINSLNDLNGKKVGVVSGSYQADYLQTHCPGAILVEFKTSHDMISSAAYGWLRAFMDEVPTAITLLKHMRANKDFKRMPGVSFTNKVHAGVLKGKSTLLRQINAGLSAITDVEMDKIKKRWLGEDADCYYGEISEKLKLTQEEIDWLKKHPEIKIGIGRAWPPFQFIGKDGAFKGMASDYMKIVKEKLKLNLTPEHYLPWPQVIEKSKTRNIDAIICASPTHNLNTHMSFTRHYLSVPMVIVTKKDATHMKGIHELYGKKVAVLRGLAAQESLRSEHPDIKLRPVDSAMEGLDLVMRGKVQSYIGNLATISYLMQLHKLTDLKIACSYKNSDMAIAVRDDWPELASILDKALTSINSKTHDSIHRRWFTEGGHKVERENPWIILSIRIGAILGVLIIMSFLWVFFRNRQQLYFHKAMAETDPAMLLSLGANGAILYQNPAFRKTIGLDDFELMGSSIFSLSHKDDEGKWRDCLEKIAKGEKFITVEHQLRLKQGKYLKFSSKCENYIKDNVLKSIVLTVTPLQDDELSEEKKGNGSEALEPPVNAQTTES